MKITSAIFASLFAMTLSFSVSACELNASEQVSYTDTESLSAYTVARIRNVINEE